jgi:hypothetical protein
VKMQIPRLKAARVLTVKAVPAVVAAVVAATVAANVVVVNKAHSRNILAMVRSRLFMTVQHLRASIPVNASKHRNTTLKNIADCLSPLTMGRSNPILPVHRKKPARVGGSG